MYEEGYRARHATEETHTAHPFCAMFKLGLLGYVGRDAELGEDIQIFSLPGEHALDDVCVLPTAQIYLIHPALDDLIASKNPQYFERLNDWNVIGRGRRWLRERVSSYVLKGDVKGYSAIMRDGARNRAFNKVFNSIIGEFASKLDFAKKSEGDSILLIDSNPSKLLYAAMNIQRDLKKSEFKCELRLGGDAGFVDIEGSSDEIQLFGMAIQNAARLEPHVEPGLIFVTEEFRKRCSDETSRKFGFAFSELGPEDVRKLEWKEGQFNIAKPSEDPILTAIWKVSAT